MAKGYEERYLITLLSAVLNQTKTPEPIRQLDWEKLYRLADYHHVAHTAYYGIIGLEESIPQTVRQRFYERYHEVVFRNERLKDSEDWVGMLLERGSVNCFLIRYSDSAPNYPIEEMCCAEFIEVGIGKKSIKLVKNIFEKADLEMLSNDHSGQVFYRVPGIKVLCYNSNMFFSKKMRKYFQNMFSSLPRKKKYRNVRELPPNDKYIFYMCRLTDNYARGEINISQIIDFWIFYKKNAESFSWPVIYDTLKKLKIEEFAERLEFLILRWFSKGVTNDNIEIYEAMESYIFTKGAEGRKISSEFLPLINTVADCYARNRRAEIWKRRIKWLFPDRKYMETIYPFLDRAGLFLPFFWIMRILRYILRYIIYEFQKRVVLKISPGIYQIIEKLPFLKKRIDEIEDKEDQTEEILK